jgi:hypothetical protein
MVAMARQPLGFSFLIRGGATRLRSAPVIVEQEMQSMTEPMEKPLSSAIGRINTPKVPSVPWFINIISPATAAIRYPANFP